MKRRFTILTAALALLLMICLPGKIWADDVTFTATDYTGEGTQSSGSEYTMEKTALSITNTKFYGNTSYAHFYANGVSTITPASGVTITSLVLTASGSSYNGYQNGGTITASTGEMSHDGTTVTWTGSASSAFTISNNKQIRWTSIVATYTISGGGTTPSINANAVNIDYDATSGDIEYTINNPVEGGVLTATTEAEWITIGTVGEEAVPFTCTINEDVVRTATVILTYTYGNDNVTKNVNVTQAANPNIPGTQNNPYTVAQARAAIDAGTGVTGVYATGIVSAIPTAWNSQYSNITFNFVDNAGDTEFLQAYRCKSSSTANASEVQVGDIVVVYGNLKNYNGTYEFDANCQLVSLTHPSILAPTFSIPAGGYAEAQSVELSCETENAVIYYTLDGTDPTNASTQYNGAISVTETTTIKAIAYVGTGNSPVAEAAYYILSDDNVYTVTEALAFGSYPQNNIFVSGIVSTAPESLISGAQLTYYISVDGQATNELEVYKGKGLNDAAFTSVDDIQVGDIVTVFGNVQDYQGTIEFGSGNYLVSFERPASPTITLNANTPVDNGAQNGYIEITIQNFEIEDYQDLNLQLCDADGQAITNNPYGWVYFDIEDGSGIGSDYVVFFEVGKNQGPERKAYFKVWALNGETPVYSNLATLTQAEGLMPSVTVTPATIYAPAEGADGTLSLTYENITDFISFDYYFCDAEGNQLEEDPDWIYAEINEENDVYSLDYLIDANDGEARSAYIKVYTYDDEFEEVYAIVTVSQEAYVAPTNNKYVKVTSTADLTDGQYLIVYETGNVAFDGGLETLDAVSNTITVTISDNEIAITDETTTAEFTINTTAGTIKSASGYYIGQTSDANGLQASQETEYTNTISVEEGNANIVSSGGAYLRFNSASNQNRFRYYKSASYTGQKAIQLYKKVEATETYTLDITGYTAGNTGGYYLIASPVNVNPANVEGMTEGTFDLYYFDQAEEDEWRNYEAQTFNLVPGKGYLYAKQATTEGEIFHFTLTGTPYSGDGMIELDYTEGGDFPGWNLVGNPFGVEAEISSDFYVMNEGGTEIIAGESELVEPMQGVFVIAENDDDYVIFEPAVAPGPGNEKLVMNVRRERGNVIDRAIVRFGEGRQLPKFQLNANSTKLYIVEGENEYAVVRSANEGEMPVSFKAAENGTYTLSVDAENMEMSYLHLIDNMTKADVDLLANPNYTFEANTTDLATRFTLVFAATGMNENTTQSFAFFNGSEWVISNMGEATLQVVDVMGRIVSSETINGNTSVSLNQTSGVYMLRLVNGDNVKVQKVVVR